MTEYLDIVEEQDGFRVRLELDDAPDKPEDDCATPILQVGMTYRDATINAFNKHAEGFQAAYNHFHHHANADTTDVFERYLRIFHGTTSFVVKDSDNYRYIGFDTPTWRKYVGCEPEYCEKAGLDQTKLAEGSAEEVVAWAQGEVYGYIVEKKVRFSKTYYITEDKYDTETGYEWVEVEDGSVWGHYGREWAEEAAREALKEAIGE